MTIVQTEEVFLPSLPGEREEVKKAIQEAAGSMSRVDAERDFQKEIYDTLKVKFGLPPKYLRKLAVAYHKQSFTQITSENDTFETLFQSLFTVE